MQRAFQAIVTPEQFAARCDESRRAKNPEPLRLAGLLTEQLFVAFAFRFAITRQFVHACEPDVNPPPLRSDYQSGLASMQQEFGKRTVVQAPRQPMAQPTPVPGQPAARDPVQLRRAVLAIVLTVTIVGGMFLLPRLAQCDGRQGLLGLDWCRLMQATVEGGARGVSVGRGTSSPGGR